MLLVLKLYIQTMASMNYIFNVVNGALYMYVLINVFCILNCCLFIVFDLIVCVDDETKASQLLEVVFYTMKKSIT